MEKNLNTDILEKNNASDILQFVDYFYLNEIQLLGHQYIISDIAYYEFAGNPDTIGYKENYFDGSKLTKTQEKDKLDYFLEKRQQLDELTKLYNEYIVLGKTDMMLQGLNSYFIPLYAQVSVMPDSVDEDLIIINNIVKYFLEYKTDNKDIIILSAEDLLDIEGKILSLLQVLSKSKELTKEKSKQLQNLLMIVLNSYKFKDYQWDTSFQVSKKEYTRDSNVLFSYEVYDLVIDTVLSFYKKPTNELSEFIIHFFKDSHTFFNKNDKIYKSEKNGQTVQMSVSEEKNKKILEKINVFINAKKIKLDTIDTNYNAINLKKIELYKTKNKIKDKLKENILGQDDIINSIIDNHFSKFTLGLNQRPISFLFAGNSGLGKTELGKQIAISLGGEALHIPLGNFKHETNIQTLIGSSVGFIGSNEQTILEKYIENCNNNASIPVIIFDEIEKSHPKIHDLFLELLDEGKVTLLNGNVLNFKNSIVILTSNIGSENVNKKKIGFLQDEDEIDNSYSSEEGIFIDAIKEYLRPEIFNRISETYIFKPLSKKIIKKIFLNKINKNIEYFQNNELIHMMFKDKINSLNPSNIFEYTNNKYDLGDIENIRKVEGDIENIILRYLESK